MSIKKNHGNSAHRKSPAIPTGKDSRISSATPGENQAPGADTIHVRLDPTRKILSELQELLDAGRNDEAFDLARRHVHGNSDLKNAYGVCLLRLGEANHTISVFRDLVLAPGGVCTRNDVPTVFKTNFALALLLDDNIMGALRLLKEIVAKTNDPGATRVLAVCQQWMAEMTWWERVLWRFQIKPKGPLQLIFSPGELT